MKKPEPEKKTPRQIAEELVTKGLIKWGPSRPGRGLSIVGTSVPEADPGPDPGPKMQNSSENPETGPSMSVEEFLEKHEPFGRIKAGQI